VYTQCSKCETVFKLSAEVLRAAGGQVRCGRCGEVFNALARLAEDSAAFAAGESPLDLEARADSILESVAAPQADQTTVTESEEFVPPGVEIARLEILDWNVPADTSMEFTLPPGELDRIFVEPKVRVLQPPSIEALGTGASPHPEDVAPPEDVAIPEDVGRGGGLEVPEAVRREMLAGTARVVRPYEALTRSPGDVQNSRRRALMLWAGAAMACALLLIAQVVHQNREWLAGHGPLSSGVRAVYSMLGAPLPAPANLSAYQLRQWGVTGDPGASGTLRVRASILNTAAQFQPYPLLRVTLADRFGKHVGARDFEPAEYLGKPTARMLAPGERVDAILDILDPGKNAEGFEIDVCLRGATRMISCAGDAAPQTKP